MVKRFHFTAILAALLLMSIFGFFVIPLVDFSKPEWPIFTSHWEGLSLVTYGKWRSLSLDYLLTDSLSGEFTVGYNFLLDYTVNILADLISIPSIVVSTVIVAPIVGFLFVLLNYYYLNRVFNRPFVALIASILIAFTADSTLLGFFFDNKEHIRTIVHVPIHTLHLATAQSLGWLLFFPTLCSVYLGFHDQKYSSKIAAGILLGLLLQAHSLTFINVAVVVSLFLASQSVIQHFKEKNNLIAITALACYSLIVFWFMSQKISAFDIVTICVLISGASLLFNLSKWKFYVLLGLAAAITVTPYSLFVLKNMNAFSGYDSGGGAIVNWPITAVYYLPHLCLFVYLAYTFIKERKIELPNQMIWLGCLLFGTALFTQNHEFNWHNHPYRFTINLIFPLSILSALALHKAWHRNNRAVFWVGMIFFTAMIHTELETAFRSGHLRFGRVHKGNPSVNSYLNQIDIQTTNDKYILLQAEHHYPLGTSFNSLIMSYSNSRGFLPDHRYIFWKNRYSNRLRSFCLIFPDFPVKDHLYKGCSEVLNQIGMTSENKTLNINNPELINVFLESLNIGIISGRYEMGQAIRKRAKALGWKITYDNGNEVIASINPPTNSSFARFTNTKYDEKGYHSTLEAQETGVYEILIMGPKLNELGKGLMIDNRSQSISLTTENLVKAKVFLNKGSHQIFIPWQEPILDHWQDNSDYINFISAITEDEIGNAVSFNKQITSF